MPASLPFDWERVNWRIRSDDLALLEVLFPGKVNEVARDVLHQYCEHLQQQAIPGSSKSRTLPKTA
jgi:hypothetical protein